MAEPFIFKMKSSKNTPVQGRRKRPIDSIMDGTTAWDGVQLMKSMKIIAAWIQVTVVLLLVGYGTWQLFEVISRSLLPRCRFFSLITFLWLRVREIAEITPWKTLDLVDLTANTAICDVTISRIHGNRKSVIGIPALQALAIRQGNPL